MPIAAVTCLRLTSWWRLPSFLWHSGRAIRQARRAPGNRTVLLRRTPGWQYWTLTLWSDEVCMRAYVATPPHRVLMPRIHRWCSQAATAVWETQDTPTWEEAEHQLRERGRHFRHR